MPRSSVLLALPCVLAVTSLVGAPLARSFVQSSAPQDSRRSGLEEVLKRGDAAELSRALRQQPKWAEAPVGEPANWVTPLGWCASRGAVDLMKVLLGAGARVDRIDRSKMTPLARSALFGHAEAARTLIEAGADPNQVSKNLHGRTAMDHAASQGRPKIVRLLLDHGANVNGERALERALRAEQSPTVKLLLEEGADPNQGYAMLAAAECAPLDILARMVEAGGDTNQQSFESVLAKATGSLAKVKYLVEHGALVSGIDGHGRRALHASAFSGTVDVAEFLIDQGAEVDAKAVHGQRPIDVAIQRGHAPMVGLLLRRGAETSFHTHVARGEAAEVQRLLKIQADLRDEVVPGQASDLHPVHVAIAFGRDEVLELLLAAGASADTTNRDVSALHLAVERNSLHAVTTLLAHGADPNAKLQDHRYGSGLRTPLHYAVESFLTKGGGSLAIVAKLLDEGADRHAKSEMKQTPLDLARQSKVEGLLKLFGETQ